MSKSPFSNIFMGQKIALKMVLLSLKLTDNVYSQGKYVDQITIHYNASKLWMTGPQDYILQHLHEPEAGPESGIKKNQQCFTQGQYIDRIL